MKKNLLKLKNPNTSTFDAIIKFASFVLTKPGYEFIRKYILRSLRKLNVFYEGRTGNGYNYLTTDSIRRYNKWLEKQLDPEKLGEEARQILATVDYKPTISIVMPVYMPPVAYLTAAIESVIGQSYAHWELCIGDDCSPDKTINDVILGYVDRNAQIKYIQRPENGHISACSNSALALATGDFILFMDHDDMLTTNCLLEVVKHINQFPQDDIIYSDEDKIGADGLYQLPHFKPDWAPDNLLSRNYIGHVTVIRRSLVEKVGGFRVGYEGSQDYDLLLRTTELTHHVGHIPKVLYHWRIHEASAAFDSEEVKPYAYLAAKKALEDTLQRRNTPGEVNLLPNRGWYRIDYKILDHKKVTIIIPTKDQVQLLKTAIDSIFQKTSYTNYEILLINNNSVTPDFFALVENYNKEFGDRFSCIDANIPFNYSQLMNIGVAACDGDYIVFLNNDVEVIKEDWLSQMVSYTQRKETGIVGVKLLYPDDTTQHAGVVLGFGGAAAHVLTNMDRDEPGYFNLVQSLNNYTAVTAACVMIRRAVYLQVGGMDEELDIEYNDTDLCLKVYTAGYYNVYLPSVELYHYESSTRSHPFSSKESWEKHEKNYNYFVGKWKPLISRDPFYNPNFSLDYNDFRPIYYNY